jgi:hypothetical protein
MNKRPGHVLVTTEVAVCMFCGRPRTLRTEQHQLGALVRTTVTCETCHRTLSSTIGVAAAEVTEPAAESPAKVEPKAAPIKPPRSTSRTDAAAKPKAAAAKPKAPANRSRSKG